MPSAFRFEGDMASSSTIKAALAWVEQGAKVIALHGIDEAGACTCGNSRCRSPGKHPVANLFPKGQHSATNNIPLIRRAFAKHPASNLGVILPPGIVALDVDGVEGVATFKGLNLPSTLSVRTGRGTHHYFSAPQPITKTKSTLDHIDIKDDQSGYIVVPPSRHHSGKQYRWQRNSVPVAALPTAFVEALARPARVTVHFGGEAAFKAGGRNSELTKIAGSLRFRGLSGSAIAGALQAINAAACAPPLDADEVDRIANSVATVFHSACFT
jgi:Bifunctional DNA primase/polymerase, N-terminal/Primase C terminal 1 (PriCT-1)